jgi:[amino group carrier protein]-lysine/ornithine hydrolase
MQDHVQAKAGIRLPLNFDAGGLANALVAWAAETIRAPMPASIALVSEADTVVELAGPAVRLRLRFAAHEVAWRSDRNNALVRSFLAAIRTVDPAAKPGFVVKTGTSDMNVVAPAWGCPILAYGPGDSSLDHTPCEHLSLDEYWKAVLVLEEALRNLCG